MQPEVLHKTSCRLCGSSDLKVVLKYLPSALADSFVKKDKLAEQQGIFPLDLTLCLSCGYAHIPDVVDPEYIYRDYVYVTTSSMGLIEHFNHYADEVIKKLKVASGSLIIDIGSNDGVLLRCFKERGLKVLGVEPAIEIAKAATASGVETIPDFFGHEVANKIRQKYGAATVVTSNNIFANIDDLKGFALGVRELLADNGVFIIECSYLLDLINNMVFDYVYHEHLSYFSVRPLDLFFKSLGMQLIDVQRVSTKGGSIRITVQLAGGPRKRDSSVEEFLAEEEKVGLARPKIFSDLDRRIQDLKTKLKGILLDIKANGKKIAGYGASATTTTLAYHFEIGSDLDFIVDDNAAKQNTFSPGFHIPVYSSDALYNMKPDYVILLAWRFADPIIKKHNKFLEQGGKFILPVPEAKVV